MIDCTHTGVARYRAEWIDRRRPFFDSFREAPMCESCIDDLESNEFVELLDAQPI
jgi:hypothetical protein